MKFESTHTPHIRNLNKKRKRRPRRYRKWQKYYSNKVWRELRDTKLTEQPLCEICLMRDEITPATEVHHIIEFSRGETDEDRWTLLLDYTNLMSVCTHCHRQIHYNN